MLQKIKRIDIPIIIILIIFMFLSSIVIYSATFETRYAGLHSSNYTIFGVLFIPIIVLSILDYRILVKHFSYILYGVGILLLLYVHFNGVNLNGSRRWINIGSMAFQPSEIMKLAVIMVLAKWLKARYEQPLRFVKDLLPMCALVGVPFFMVLQQPDLGTSIVFICIFVGMLWIANIQWKHILAGTLTVAVVITVITILYFYNFEMFSKIVKPHQMSRIQTFIDPLSDPDKMWHVDNSIHAIASGQLMGEGFLQGSLIRGGFIPYSYADSIFVVIGEEFGFVGVSVLLLFYFILIYRMVIITLQTKDLEGRYLVVGIISMLTLQIFQNIAMHIGIMPLTGIALPFISYGGSSLLTNMLAMGLVLSVKTNNRI
ncbi:MAG TPA: rod shape-determining protein RodA [Candidatus Paenibacillus intestinavium]|nr:rod shape-determining protein RodA [Candidatus Paenibacillus intestinavium]